MSYPPSPLILSLATALLGCVDALWSLTSVFQFINLFSVVIIFLQLCFKIIRTLCE